MTLDDVLAAAYPVLPVLVIENPAHALPLAETLVANGVRVLEITLRTDVALTVIQSIAKHVPEAIVGAGTVLTEAQLRHVKDAGAQFAVSPGTTARLLTAARELEIALLPGIVSASEVQLALEYGCERLKFFPAAAAGGPAVIQALYGPFPQVRFCPTGGIQMQSAPAYLTLPNVACVGGSWLAPKALLDTEDWPAIAALAHTSRGLASASSH
ncbi:MAG TPA: bifunctional 4-hydroxy-2-oxoglutarate aldolase/2-dehydro-3-deoxy-phosphogluconate aldolase [Candidatus Tectomicrobia bacterium]